MYTYTSDDSILNYEDLATHLFQTTEPGRVLFIFPDLKLEKELIKVGFQRLPANNRVILRFLKEEVHET